jgi:hypothetical protein
MMYILLKIWGESLHLNRTVISEERIEILDKLNWSKEMA